MNVSKRGRIYNFYIISYAKSVTFLWFKLWSTIIWVGMQWSAEEKIEMSMNISFNCVYMYYVWTYMILLILFFHYLDVKECELFHGCEHKCQNLIGGYNCDCHLGYLLADNRRQCIFSMYRGKVLSCYLLCMPWLSKTFQYVSF